ncbi:LytR C-terminal domain-containing protein [Nocardia brasiliensis]|uniref:LytR C-terminal domain-containing protein n=1 Tax=Nocardia brasiliensis TaxID=37326 RepID=UPI0024568510|nr:LytR C-terminal domain-containing protein [Nocardia brasiliensis]
MSYPNPTSGGPPLRALAMVLIALAIVFGGLGAMSLSKSDADSSSSGPSESTTATAAPQMPASTTVDKTTPAPSSASSTPATSAVTTPPTTTVPTTTGSAAAKAVPVRVLNNSMIAGLAAKTAGQLTAEGWSVVETGNYPGANVPKTTVYYGNSPGDKDAALAIADELGVTAEPKSSGLGESSPGVTVIVTGN